MSAEVHHHRKKPYSDYLLRPVWSKAHRIRLATHYKGSTKQELADESSIRKHHLPGKRSVTSIERAAGTSGASHGVFKHPDDFDLVADMLQHHIGKPTFKLTDEQRNQLLAIVKDAGQPRLVREHFQRLLDDPSIVISARDVKLLTPELGPVGSLSHGWARNRMPISEAEMKAQNWEGKVQQDKQIKQMEANDAKKEGRAPGPSVETQIEQKKGGLSLSDQQVNRDQDKGVEHGDPTDKLNAAERRFMDELITEAGAINSFKNSAAKPREYTEEELKFQERFVIQAEDHFTPDNWVPRSDHLMRLAGRHPFDAEADVREIFDAGMITPLFLHYTRNHGAVPKLAWETHALEIFSEPPGLLKPRSMTMDDIAALPAIEMAVTFACDGNRRGEFNMTKRTCAFSWSVGGVSTCRWKGPLLRDILVDCGFDKVPDGDRIYINFEGADLPSEGPYATSMPIAHVMDPSNDVILAYAGNGRVLTPDHGYPLRIILPGIVGGRQIKWLKKIWLTKTPNTSHYQIWDNRIVPSFVEDRTSPLSNALYHHPSTEVWAQNVNAIACRPSQGENIPLTLDEQAKNDNMFDAEGVDPNDPMEKLYRVQGFAYNGSGSEIVRVEISLDGGKNWLYCFRKFLDEPLRHGTKFWAWIFWHVDVPVKALCATNEIIVRAADQARNVMPEQPVWNHMGMLNNSWYRLKGQTASDPLTGKTCLSWKHPVAPGAKAGGWMSASADVRAEIAAADSNTSGREMLEFTLEEVEKHNKEHDCWIILNNCVYDATSVLAWHPGGAAAILTYAGKATVHASVQYNSIHDAYARRKTQEVMIGKLSAKGIQALEDEGKRVEVEAAALRRARQEYALQPEHNFPATLVNVKHESDDTSVYTFKLPEINGQPGRLGLAIGKHLNISTHWLDSVVLRPYTPIRPIGADEEDGTFDVLIKTYFPESGPFPPGGTMGNYLSVLKVGETIDINGPIGGIEYTGNGNFTIEGRDFHFDQLNLVAGGSGITPHWQLIHAIMKNPQDSTTVSLINCNKTFNDILLRKELTSYAGRHSDKFKLFHCIEHALAEDEKLESYNTGFMNEEIMRKHFYTPEDAVKVGTFLCEPPGLIKYGAMPALKKMGFEEGKTVFGF